MGKKELDLLVQNLDKTFGKGSFFKIGSQPKVNIKTLDSGSILLNAALGGGYPYGRIIEIFGWESSGKTTLALHAIAEAQKIDGNVAFIDAEHALDFDYAEKLGVVTDELFISQPSSGEEALEILDKIVESGQFSVVVVDSVSALTPKAEIEGEMGDSKMGLHARLMSQAMRKVTSKIHKSDTIVIFINQLREKIGVMFGNPQVTTGGNALKFYASQRIEVVRSTQLKDTDGNPYGHKLKLKVVKNKIAPPFKVAETSLIYGIGVSKLDEIIDVAESQGIIKRSGSWFSYQDTKLGQGLNNVRELLQDNPELVEEIYSKLQ